MIDVQVSFYDGPLKGDLRTITDVYDNKNEYILYNKYGDTGPGTFYRASVVAKVQCIYKLKKIEVGTKTHWIAFHLGNIDEKKNSKED
jgi:hypothetical protein